MLFPFLLFESRVSQRDLRTPIHFTIPSHDGNSDKNIEYHLIFNYLGEEVVPSTPLQHLHRRRGPRPQE